MNFDCQCRFLGTVNAVCILPICLFILFIHVVRSDAFSGNQRHHFEGETKCDVRVGPT